MPRILRNYLISFAIIGIIFLIVHLLDLYFKSNAVQQNGRTPQTQGTSYPPLAPPGRGIAGIMGGF